jgi:hypothetical protein
VAASRENFVTHYEPKRVDGAPAAGGSGLRFNRYKRRRTCACSAPDTYLDQSGDLADKLAEAVKSALSGGAAEALTKRHTVTTLTPQLSLALKLCKASLNGTLRAGSRSIPSWAQRSPGRQDTAGPLEAHDDASVA